MPTYRDAFVDQDVGVAFLHVRGGEDVGVPPRCNQEATAVVYVNGDTRKGK